MSLLLGLIVGLACGLSAFSGAFLALPLLVIVAGIGLHQSVPIALTALALCMAVTAGDATRARQCDIRLAVLLCIGGAPAVLFAAWLAQHLGVTLLATLFFIGATLSGAMLFNTSRRWPGAAPAPAMLWRAPRRALADASNRHRYTLVSEGVVVLSGVCSGVLAALFGAPCGWLTLLRLGRIRPAEPFVAVGTYVLATAIVAALGAMAGFAFAPAVPGYTAGLYVLGAVAGLGAARRLVDKPRLGPATSVIALAAVVGALALWLAVVTDWRG